MKPKVAIIGRPNVGKSALFNKICKQRLAIVDEAEGVTRDRLYGDAELFGRPFQVIDTGGIDPRSEEIFGSEVRRQAFIAVEEADALILVVDSTVGITDLDVEVARILLKSQKPLVLAVNKIDHPSQLDRVHPFWKLGIKDLVGVSAVQNFQIAELLEAALKTFPKQSDEEEALEGVKVAIVGRTNVGKSSLLNGLLNEERCIVSALPGTTRDCIDANIEYEGQRYVFIDTAGIRRKQAEHDAVDKFAAIRTQRALERCDVALLLLEATQGMTTQDKRIANLIEEKGKGCVLLLNKWDLAKGFRMEHSLRSIEEEVPFLKHCPRLCISALTQRNLPKIFPLIQEVFEAGRQRLSTHALNKAVERAVAAYHPPMIGGKRLRIYYMTQVKTQPPTFLLFVNAPYLMTDTYKRYLYNKFREVYPFSGTPLKILLKGKVEKKGSSQGAREFSPPHEEIIPDEEAESILDDSAF